MERNYSYLEREFKIAKISLTINSFSWNGKTLLSHNISVSALTVTFLKWVYRSFFFISSKNIKWHIHTHKQKAFPFKKQFL